MNFPLANNKVPLGPNESPILGENSPLDSRPGGPNTTSGSTDFILDPVERDAHQLDLSNSKVAEHPEPIRGDHPKYESPRMLD